MSSPFLGLDIAGRALRTQQTLVDIANQNIANANTPGYSRQSGVVQASAAYPVPVFNQTGIGQLGTGVEVTAITRARDTFLDGQIHTQLSTQGKWDARTAALAQLEATVNEPSTSGLSAALTKYWQGWQQVGNSPADASSRTSLVQQGQALVDAFHNQAQQLTQQRSDLDSQVGLTVTNINDYAQQIANINVQVAQIESSGMKANDLRDQRGLLMDKLSTLAKVTYVESSEGSVNVFLGSRQLVDRSAAHQLQAVTPPGQAFTQVQWASDGAPTSVIDGQLKGILDSRDIVVKGQSDTLNALANRVITSVNSLHASGVGLDGKSGVPFFDGTDATTIAVDAALTGSGGGDHVAAATMYADSTSSTGYSFAKGDSSNALAIASLATSTAQLTATSGLKAGTTFAGQPGISVLGTSVQGAAPGTTYSLTVAAGTSNVTFGNGSTTQPGTITVGTDGAGNQVINVTGGSFGVQISLTAPPGASLSTVLANLNGQNLTDASAPATIGDQYAQQVAALGVDSRTAQNESTNQQVMITHLQTARSAVSSVSLDEETTHLIQYQRAYQAAARVVSVVDGMLDTLINHTLI